MRLGPLPLCAVLAPLACLVTAAAGHTQTTKYASESGIVLIAPCHAENGDLLPAIPSAEFLDRAMRFLLVDQEQWFKGTRLTDDSGAPLPPYFLHAKLNPHGEAYTQPVPDRSVVYPAFHHALAIQAFASYYVYSGNADSLRRACQIADWNISHSTPHDWLYGDLPYSTFVNGMPGGFVDGDAIMTDKPAIMALAYVRLHRMTGQDAYLQAAVRIADTLARNQRPEGNWPFRVNPQTGEVREEYTSSAIYAAMLFEAIDRVTHTDTYRPNRDLAVRWVLENPVRTLDWRGFYEDVGNDPNNRTNWDCIDTIRYLAAHRDEIPTAERAIEKLKAWIAENFVERDHMFAPAAGVREQKVCFSIMGGHAIHWATMIADLYRTSGDEKERWEVVQAMNFLTYLIQPDNRIVVGADHGLRHPQGAPYWYSGQFSCVAFFLETLAAVPELATDGETHLLRAAGEVETIEYGDKSVTYSTDAAGTDVLKLAFTPDEVQAGSVLLQRGKDWEFDEQSHLMRVTRGPGRVTVQSR